MNITPVIEMGIDLFVQMEGKSFEKIHAEMSQLRKDVKEATKYFWDNSHFRVTNRMGKQVLKVAFFDDDITFWNYLTDETVMVLKGTHLTKMDIKLIEEMIENVSNAKHRCLECGEWVISGKYYSYAGFVCENCYDSERHMGPDTRGD